MLKILVSALAITAVMSSTALACNGHKGGKGPTATATTTPVTVLVVRPA